MLSDWEIDRTECGVEKISKLLRKFECDNIESGLWSDLPFSYVQCELLRLSGELILLPPPHQLIDSPEETSGSQLKSS